ncbi:hypothetical protein [Candidatus Sarmatiella mevalonica]|nr:hypothetical protein [Candidatus Sarmatiella mevalonica]
MSIITGAGIHQKELALSLPGPAKDKSKTHRIYRLLDLLRKYLINN